MHWLKEFRLSYIKKNDVVGLSREELAQMVRRKGVGCSAVLIGIIEGGGITHPNIADKIAAVAGASVEQRDSMVHKMHRGKGGYKPPRMKPQQPGHIRPMAPGYIGANARPVVMLAPNAVIMGKYASAREAALAARCSVSVVGNRCNRKVPGRTNEFSACGYTFRWQNEWEGMSVDERIEDMRRAEKMISLSAKPVVMLDRNAAVCGCFESINAAANAAYCDDNTVVSRCNRKISERTNEFSICGYTFRWLNEWEKMSAEERIEDMRRAEKKIAPNTKAVVMLDRNAAVCGCFESINAAAHTAHCRENAVASRCTRKVSEKTNEFLTCGYTFRWQKEWESMSAEERIEDMRRAEAIKKPRRNERSGGCDQHEKIPAAGDANQPG